MLTLPTGGDCWGHVPLVYRRWFRKRKFNPLSVQDTQPYGFCLAVTPGILYRLQRSSGAILRQCARFRTREDKGVVTPDPEVAVIFQVVYDTPQGVARLTVQDYTPGASKTASSARLGAVSPGKASSAQRR